MAENKTPKIMLHVALPNQIGGPKTSASIIYNSYLKTKYQFGYLYQNIPAGGKVNMKAIKDMIYQIKQYNPDLIHISGLQNTGFHAILAARLAGKKNIIVTIRGSSTDALDICRLKKFIYGWIIEPFTLLLASHVYTVSKAMEQKKMIRRFSRNFVGTIHNSAPDISYNSINSINFRNTYKIDKSKKIVAIVGRIVYDKGITYIKDAIKKNPLHNFTFVFIGDGPLISDLEKELADEIQQKKVFLLGHQKDVLSILSECDIFLFATLHENLSNALLEACSLGLFPIVTDVGGNSEVIKHKYNGLLIPPENSDSIVEALMYIDQNPIIALEYSKNAKRTIEAEFSQEKSLPQLDNLYKHILSKN